MSVPIPREQNHGAGCPHAADATRLRAALAALIEHSVKGDTCVACDGIETHADWCVVPPAAETLALPAPTAPSGEDGEAVEEVRFVADGLAEWIRGWEAHGMSWSMGSEAVRRLRAAADRLSPPPRGRGAGGDERATTAE